MAENKNAKTPTDGGTGFNYAHASAITVLRQPQALETEQKTAVSPGKGTGFIDARALGITVLRQAVETEQKTAVKPAKQWVGLTDEEIQDLSYLSQKIDEGNAAWFDRWEFARAIEAKLKEKNT